MSSRYLDSLGLEAETDSNSDSATDSETTTDDEVTDDDQNKNAFRRANETIDKYLRAESGVFRELQCMRVKGWRSRKAKRYFAEKKRKAEENPTEAIALLADDLDWIAVDLQNDLNAFTIESKPVPGRILDLSVTPGAFLNQALVENRRAHALAFNLPEGEGGFAANMRESQAIRIQMLDITMLAEDMGVSPNETRSNRHAERFRHSRYFDGGRSSRFDLVICDSTIEPTWGMFRRSPSREYRRRLLSQLIIGLEQLREGGKMIIQLHKLENIQTIQLIRKFSQFANFTTFKHDLWVGKLAYFYIVATEVESTSQKARDAVQEWKREWKVVTLGTDKQWRQERDRLARCGNKGVEGVLKQFGPKLLDLGNYIWQEQIDLLAKPPW